MKIAVIHKCGGCDVEGRSAVESLPDGWDEVQILRTLIALCARCSEKAREPGLETFLADALRRHLAEPHVGDDVILLVDGCRGKFKGEKGVVSSRGGGSGPHGASYGIRVPGKIAPGEKEEYAGPYFRSQFRLIHEPPSPTEAS